MWYVYTHTMSGHIPQEKGGFCTTCEHIHTYLILFNRVTRNGATKILCNYIGGQKWIFCCECMQMRDTIPTCGMGVPTLLRWACNLDPKGKSLYKSAMCPASHVSIHRGETGIPYKYCSYPSNRLSCAYSTHICADHLPNCSNPTHKKNGCCQVELQILIAKVTKFMISISFIYLHHYYVSYNQIYPIGSLYSLFIDQVDGLI